MGAVVTKNKFVIYSAGYNCSKYVKRCMDSIQSQEYTNYKHIIVDDASTDDTYNTIVQNKNSNTVIFKTSKNVGWLANSVKYLRCDLSDIIVLVDLDDFLSHNNVLNIVNDVYNKYNCWLTYGSFLWLSNNINEGIAYPDSVVKSKTFREFEWRAVHPQTFKYFLWYRIEKEDLQDDDGNYLMSAYDIAIMHPMLEMSPPNKIRCIKDTLYVYDNTNPLHIGKMRKHEQINNEKLIRSKQKYEELI